MTTTNNKDELKETRRVTTRGQVRHHLYCTYCLMPNHVHLLIREREDEIGWQCSVFINQIILLYDETIIRS